MKRVRPATSYRSANRNDYVDEFSSLAFNSTPAFPARKKLLHRQSSSLSSSSSSTLRRRHNSLYILLALTVIIRTTMSFTPTLGRGGMSAIFVYAIGNTELQLTEKEISAQHDKDDEGKNPGSTEGPQTSIHRF